MKRRRVPGAEPVVPKDVLELAKLAAESERSKAPAKCVVCGAECAPNSTEGLCWVCRRLKLSAWRDTDPQIGAQDG